METENAIKLDILRSLARSQKALARMIEQVADVTERSHKTAGHLCDNIQSISHYQRSIMLKMIGIRIKRRRRGLPGAVWLRADVRGSFPEDGSENEGKQGDRRNVRIKAGERRPVSVSKNKRNPALQRDLKMKLEGDVPTTTMSEGQHPRRKIRGVVVGKELEDE
ncbi:hypothetical protein [Paenibacillus swuensis]|uniref:hypothetical protein n=1 Tax=Paenibacillus swuensis TaxID=1178515 RepID=UPI000838A9BA|nr:hypothetical protein [Paenibacillus swuensis]